MKVIGLQRKVGVYQGYDYDNAVICCTCNDKSAIFGCSVVKIKIKWVAFLKCLKSLGFEQVGDLKDKEITVSYNRWGKPESFDIVDS